MKHTYGHAEPYQYHYFKDTLSDQEEEEIAKSLPDELRAKLKLTVEYARSWIFEH